MFTWFVFDKEARTEKRMFKGCKCNVLLHLRCRRSDANESSYGKHTRQDGTPAEETCGAQAAASIHQKPQEALGALPARAASRVVSVDLQVHSYGGCTDRLQGLQCSQRNLGKPVGRIQTL
ncbi:hypothetical protein D3C74_375950 [compost metagenome]